MATLQQVIDQIQAAVGAISGIRAAPDEPPENMSVFPFAIAYSQTGFYEQKQGRMLGSHSIAVELHVARKDLARDVQKAMSYAKSVPNAIYAAQEAGSVTSASYLGRVTYVFGPMAWGEVDTLGFRFVVEEVRTDDLIT